MDDYRGFERARRQLAPFAQKTSADRDGDEQQCKQRRPCRSYQDVEIVPFLQLFDWPHKQLAVLRAWPRHSGEQRRHWINVSQLRSRRAGSSDRRTRRPPAAPWRLLCSFAPATSPPCLPLMPPTGPFVWTILGSSLTSVPRGARGQRPADAPGSSRYRCPPRGRAPRARRFRRQHRFIYAQIWRTKSYARRGYWCVVGRGAAGVTVFTGVGGAGFGGSAVVGGNTICKVT